MTNRDKLLMLKIVLKKKLYHIYSHVVATTSLWTRIYVIVVFYKLKLGIIRTNFFFQKITKNIKMMKEIRKQQRIVTGLSNVKRRNLSVFSFIATNISSIYYVYVVSIVIMFIDYLLRILYFFDKWYFEEYHMYPAVWEHIVTDFFRLFKVIRLLKDEFKLALLGYTDGYYESMIYRHYVPYMRFIVKTRRGSAWLKKREKYQKIGYKERKPIYAKVYKEKRKIHLINRTVFHINTGISKIERLFSLIVQNIKGNKTQYKINLPKLPNIATRLGYNDNKYRKGMFTEEPTRDKVLYFFFKKKNAYTGIQVRMRLFYKSSVDMAEYLRLLVPDRRDGHDRLGPINKHDIFEERNMHRTYKEERMKGRTHFAWRNYKRFIKMAEFFYWADTKRTFQGEPALKKNIRDYYDRFMGFLNYVTWFGLNRSVFDLFPAFEYVSKCLYNPKIPFLRELDAFYDFFVYGWMLYTFFFFLHYIKLTTQLTTTNRAFWGTYRTINTNLHNFDTIRRYKLERERLPKFGINFLRLKYIIYVNNANQSSRISYSFDSESTGFSEREVLDETEFHMSGREFKEWLELHFIFRQRLFRKYWLDLTNNAIAYSTSDDYLVNCLWDLNSYKEPYATCTFIQNKRKNKQQKFASLFPGYTYEIAMSRLWKGLSPTPWDQMFIPFNYDSKDRMQHMIIPPDAENIRADHLLRTDKWQHDIMFDIVARTMYTQFAAYTPSWILIHPRLQNALYLGLDGKRGIQYNIAEQFTRSGDKARDKALLKIVKKQAHSYNFLAPLNNNYYQFKRKDRHVLQVTKIYYNRVITFPIDNCDAIVPKFSNTMNIMADTDIMANQKKKKLKSGQMDWDWFPAFRSNVVEKGLRATVLETEILFTYEEQLQYFEELNQLVRSNYSGYIYAREEIVHHSDLARIFADSVFRTGPAAYFRMYNCSYNRKDACFATRETPPLIISYIRTQKQVSECEDRHSIFFYQPMTNRKRYEMYKERIKKYEMYKERTKKFANRIMYGKQPEKLR
jgi:hypothetical protein